MTVQAQNSTQYYEGPIAIGTILPIVDFTFIDNSHVSAKIRGEEYIWKYGEDYIVSGAGELVRTIEILKEVEEGQVLAIYLDVPITQNIAPEEGGNFPASTNEYVLDKLTYICQMLYARTVRSMQVSIDTAFDGTLPALLPNKAIKINADGTGLELSDLDPDAAVKEIQIYIQQAKKFADQATAAAVDTQAIINSLNATADKIYAAAEEAGKKADNAVARVEAAEDGKLNSKEIATILKSSIPQTNSDLQPANGRVITSEDKNYEQLHSIYMTQKRKLTDVHTKYYKYNSYNYSRVWYSTVKSIPDRFYNLSDILIAEAGTWYLFDRQGNPVAMPSISVKSYYKYELINAVGDSSPHQNILWPVLAGDLQTAEPSTEDQNDFWAYKDDERVGAHIENITNIVVLPPDITSEFRRIQITRTVGDNIYYYYYKAIPIEIHAYMIGDVAELNLSGVAGAQTADTVIHPYLVTTNDGYLDIITNNEFMSTREWVEAALKPDDYNKFYSAIDEDQTYEIENLHDEVDVIGQPTNRLGVFSGFTPSDYLQISYKQPYETAFDGTKSLVPIKDLDIEFHFKTAAVFENSTVMSCILGSDVEYEGLWIGREGATAADKNRVSIRIGNKNVTGANTWQDLNGKTTLVSKEELEPDTEYVVKVFYGIREVLVSAEDVDNIIYDYKQMLELYVAKVGEDFADEPDSEVELPIGQIGWQSVSQIGLAAGWSNTAYCQGSVDLTKSYIKINNELIWGKKVVPYAKDSKGNFITQYPYNKKVDYQGQLASNVYETLPEGYTVVGNKESVDGWFAPAAANQGHFLGTGINTKFISTRADNYINISGRFMTARATNNDTPLIQLAKSQHTFSPFRLLSDNGNVLLCLGGASTSAWSINRLGTGLFVELSSEYYFEFKADFSKKYKLVDNEYFEVEDGTLYKYELLLRKWIGPEDNDIAQTATIYNAHRFGSAALDTYLISGIGNSNIYAAGTATYMNMYSVLVNGRPIFNDNMHVIARPANMTALPRIADKDGVHSYVVCANGITEDVVLATPQQQIEAYTQSTILPQIEVAKNTANSLVTQSAQKAIQQIDGAYAGQLSNMTANYTQSMANISQNYNISMEGITENYNNSMQGITNNYNNSMQGITNNYNQSMETITNTQVVLIDSYVNGTSWYRVYSDGWCEQGGTFVGQTGTIFFLKPYRDINYIITHAEGYGGGGDTSVTHCIDTNIIMTNSFKIIKHWLSNTNSTFYWQACGYIDLTE